MEFSGLVRNQDVVVENGLTSEDLFENSIYTALKKFKTAEVDETEGFNYIRKTILTNNIFAYKKKKSDLLVFPGSDLSRLADN